MRRETRKEIWASLGLEGAELGLHEQGPHYFSSEMLTLWATIRDGFGNKPVPQQIAEQLAEHISCLIADYIESFPAEVQVEAARHLLYGFLWEELYYDTIDLDEDAPESE